MFKVLSKIELPDKLIRVAIKQEEPYTWHERKVREIEGGTDEDYIKAVLEVVADELNPDGAIAKLKKLTADLEDADNKRVKDFKEMKAEFARLKASLEATQSAIISATIPKLPDEPKEGLDLDSALAGLPEDVSTK